jgi:hypothetical protein
VWLSNAHKRFAFTLFPTSFVLVMTLWALGQLTLTNFRAAQGLDVQFFNAMASTALIVLAIYLALTALSRLRGQPGGEVMVTTALPTTAK